MRPDRGDSGGIFAVARHREAAHLACLGLHGLQHRGFAGVGLVSSNGEALRAHGGLGRVEEVLGAPEVQALAGQLAVGQVHPAVSAAELRPSPVALGRTRDHHLGVALVGRFTNGARARAELHQRGALFRGTSDAELLLHQIAHSAQRTFVNRLVEALWRVEGGYTAVVCTPELLVAVRDPRGFWPLVLGELDDAVLLASEECAIRFVGGEIRGEVAPGELLVVDRAGTRSVRPFGRVGASAACGRELAALARSDGRAFGRDIHAVRSALGAELAREAPGPQAAVVVPFPGGGEPVAAEYARRCQLPAEAGLLLDPHGGIRADLAASGTHDLATRARWHAVPGVVRSREVVLVVPMIDTAGELRGVVGLLRQAGAAAVHVRSATPLVRGACFYGLSGPTPDELAVHQGEGLVGWLGAASVAALSVEAFRAALGAGAGDGAGCTGCFTGDYPLPPQEPDDQLSLFEP